MVTKKEVKVISLNTIHRTITPGEHGDRSKGIAGVKPEIQIIPGGVAFMVDTVKHSGMRMSEYDDLMKSGAIRDWSAEDERILGNMTNMVGGGEYDEALTNEDRGGASVVVKDNNAAVKKSTPPAEKQPVKETANAVENGQEISPVTGTATASESGPSEQASTATKPVEQGGTATGTKAAETGSSKTKAKDKAKDEGAEDGSDLV